MLLAQEDFLYFVNESNEAIYSRLNIIENAEKELLVSYYIFGNDEASLIFLALLLDKKEKNPEMDIRILLDAAGSKIDRSYLYYCEKKGIQIREFHPIPKLFPQFSKISITNFVYSVQNFNMRMHDKFIISDSSSFITGGRNIENTYYGLSKRNFNDRDIYFYSKKLTKDVRKYYLTLWKSRYVQRMNYSLRNKSKAGYKKAENKFASLKELIARNRLNYEILYRDFHPLKIGIPFKKAVFLSAYDQEIDALNPVLLSTSLFNLTYKVRKSIIIQTPYLLPTRPLFNLLDNLVKRKIDIQFITNSNCSTDVMPISAAYDNQKKKFEKLGIDIYEYMGPHYMHSKSAVYDDSIALVGSYNVDPRSANINTELVFIIDDKNIAKKLKDIILEDKKNCVKVEKSDINSWGGYYGCERTEKEIMKYLIFRILTRFSIFYNQF